ncbi:P-loop containing nucleoside triphosphate hydrolase protein [Chytriomyces sp. MP71]|nr:P-loop containing nucleoside triphosphate hydrolase protein [Chytriomyces sp. MP71]
MSKSEKEDLPLQHAVKVSEATDPLSFVTLSWLSRLVIVGSKRPLVTEDLPDLPKASTSEAVAKILDPFQSKLKAYLANPGIAKKPPSFFPDIWSKIGTAWIVSVLLDAFATFLTTTQPVVMAAIISYLGKGNSDFFITSPIVLAIVFFLMTFLNVICKQVVQQMFRKMRFNVRSVLTTSIYAKSMKLSNASASQFNKGRILQMINLDVEQISRVIEFGHNVVLVPFQLAFTFYYLVTLFGHELYPVGIVTGIFALFAPLLISVMVMSQKSYMEAGDKRVRLLREILEGIKIIKYRAHERIFNNDIAEIRQKQLRSMTIMLVGLLVFIFFVIAVPFAMIVGTFIVYSQDHTVLAPEVIFPAINYFMGIFQPFQALPGVLMVIGNGVVSWNRVRSFLVASESEFVTMKKDDSFSGNAIEIQNATFKWETSITQEEEKGHDVEKVKTSVDGSDGTNESTAKDKKGKKSKKSNKVPTPPPEIEPFFKDMNVVVPANKLTAIVGTVGSGKSSFFSACIGEMTKVEGNVNVFGSVALCQQQPWLMSLNLRQNITFGHPFDQAKMDEAIRLAGLEVDLHQLPQGLETEVGEKGITLSGGQKARVALARAIYGNSDIYLLDDPLAALDAHVGKHVFDECIRSGLAGKTRVLITHHLHVLSHVDHIIVFDHGRIVEQGSYEDLAVNGHGSGHLQELLKNHIVEDHNEEDDVTNAKTKKVIKKSESKEKKEDNKGLIEEEDRKTGAVASKYIWNYFKMGGIFYFVCFLIFSIGYSVFNFGMTLWLSYWSYDSIVGTTRYGLKASDYLLVYAIIVALNFICTPLLTAGIQAVSYFAAKKYHAGAMVGLMRAPMSWYDSQPLGRILNRMTKDVEELDISIWNDLLNFAIVNGMVLVAIAQSIYGTLYTLIFIGILAVLYVVLLKMYRSNMREIKRLVAAAKSPLSAYISECVAGTSTIRAFQAAGQTTAHQRKLMDESIIPAWTQENITNWFSLRLQLFLSLITLFLSLFAIYAHQDANVMGVALSGVISLNEVFMVSLLCVSRTEADFVAVERLDAYCHELPQEDAEVLDTDPSESEWPREGRVSISNLEVKYATKAEPVIKDLSIEFKGSEKIGVVGRTGSGKSTLMTALFRIVPPSAGSIVIDGVDASKVGLRTLRRGLQIIPQEPVLFTGTVRKNIDIEGKFTDSQIWEALELVGMKEYVSELPEKLEAPVTEHGENLSMGQRQLMMLASAICNKPKILVMDEASSSVDQAADLLIQSSIRTHFANTTVISIAHRVNSIADFDKVMVLDAGRLVEFDTPSNLLLREGGIFKSLVDATGFANATLVAEIANKH